MTVCESCDDGEKLTPELLASIAPTMSKTWVRTSLSDNMATWSNEPLDVSLEQDMNDASWVVTFFENHKQVSQYKFADKYEAGTAIEAFVALWDAPGKIETREIKFVPDSWVVIRATTMQDGQLVLYKDVADRVAPHKIVKLVNGKPTRLSGQYDSISFVEEDDAVKSYSYLVSHKTASLEQLQKALVWDDMKNMLSETVI